MNRLLLVSGLIVTLILLLPAHPRQTSAADQEVILLIDVTASIAQAIPGTPPVALRVWGWALKGNSGWTGLMENYIFGTGTNSESSPTSGVRGASAVLQIFGGDITETSFTLRGRIQQVTNSSLFKVGDIRTLTGSWITGQASIDEPISDGKPLTLALVGTILRR